MGRSAQRHQEGGRRPGDSRGAECPVDVIRTVGLIRTVRVIRTHGLIPPTHRSHKREVQTSGGCNFSVAITRCTAGRANMRCR